MQGYSISSSCYLLSYSSFMRHATIYCYQLPMTSGLILREQQLTLRQGFIVRLTENSKQAWGEIAPLPGFSTESLSLAKQQLCEWVSAWQQGKTPPLEPLAPSVAFGLSMALLELENGLICEGNYQSAILCSGEMAQWQQQLNHNKPCTAKLKIGIDPPSIEGERVAAFLQQFPLVSLRLDANRRWSLPQAVEFAEKIATPLRRQIEFIEEPCHTAVLSRQFAQQMQIAIAWDESLREPNFTLFAEPHLAAVVIKPTLTGSVARILSLIEQAKQRGLRVVISSSLESSLALSQLARLSRQYCPESVPGLDTLNLFNAQLIRSWPGCALPLHYENSPMLQKIGLF